MISLIFFLASGVQATDFSVTTAAKETLRQYLQRQTFENYNNLPLSELMKKSRSVWSREEIRGMEVIRKGLGPEKVKPLKWDSRKIQIDGQYGFWVDMKFRPIVLYRGSEYEVKSPVDILYRKITDQQGQWRLVERAYAFTEAVAQQNLLRQFTAFASVFNRTNVEKLKTLVKEGTYSCDPLNPDPETRFLIIKRDEEQVEFDYQRIGVQCQTLLSGHKELFKEALIRELNHLQATNAFVHNSEIEGATFKAGEKVLEEMGYGSRGDN